MLMNMTANDLDLLRQFACNQSQDAFTALVNRHVNLVFSSALRQVRSPQLAEEIAQSVFADLARNAGKLNDATGNTPDLTAWLYQVTRRTAIDVIRKESRRQLREQTAVEMTNMNATTHDWRQIEPLLDDAMAALDQADRSAILLRYFQTKSLREVGEALGVSDDTAQKRVSRAVERLREFFLKRKVAIGTSGLVVLISANAVHAAPIGLAATISATAVLAETAIPTSTVIAATKTIVMTTLQKALITATIGASVATPFLIQHQAQVKLRAENQSLRQQVGQLTGLTAENERLSKLVVQGKASQTAPSAAKPALELLRLRGQVGLLQNQNQELAKLLLERQPATAAADFVPSTAWADDGDATPEAAAGTFAWAIKSGNKDRLAAILWSPDDPGTNAPGLVDLVAKDFQSLMSEIEDSKLVLTDQTAPDAVTLWYQSRFKDGHTLVSPITLQRVGNNWKLKLVVGDSGAGVEAGK